MERVLCVVVCGAGPAADVATLVDLAKAQGWSVFVVASPSAVPFLDLDGLETATGSPVLHQHRVPTEPRAGSAGRASAVIVAPATFNTVNKVAAGAADTYALGVVAEAIGLGVPVVMVPFVSTALAARLPFERAVELLRAEGVTLLHGPGEWEPHSPDAGGHARTAFPWRRALELASGERAQR
jgi:phosphopantothenoylcysteine synthetase/decarboxylase